MYNPAELMAELDSDHFVRYALIHVAKRHNARATLGILLIEPEPHRAAFMGVGGRYDAKLLPATEIRAAYREAELELQGQPRTLENYLGGIVQAFDTHWGELTTLRLDQYEMPKGATPDEQRRALLMGALSEYREEHDPE